MSLYTVLNRALLQTGQLEDVSQVVANFDAIASVLNGNIENVNVNAAAAIDYSKLSVPAGAIAIAKLTGYPGDITKILHGDGSWSVLTPGPTITMATSAPGSPVNGDIWIAVDNVTTPVYQWQFRYHTGSGNAEKWEFIGGAVRPLSAAPFSTGASTIAADIPSGLTFTIPFTGVYTILWGTGLSNNGINGTVNYLNINGADVDTLSFTNRGANDQFYYSKMYPQTALTAGWTVKWRYSVSGGTATFAQQWCILNPVRLN